MKAVSIYELSSWDIQVQYGADFTEIKNANRWFHTLVDEKEYHTIVNWTVETVKGLCLRKLLANT